MSVAVIPITDLHVTVMWCISLTINIYYLPQIWQFPSCIGLINTNYFVLMLQAVLWKCSVAVFRRAGARDLIYDFLPLSCLWNSAPHVSTMFWSHLDLSDSVSDILHLQLSLIFYLFSRVVLINLIMPFSLEMISSWVCSILPASPFFFICSLPCFLWRPCAIKSLMSS